MATGLEIALLVFVLAALLGAAQIVRAVRPFIVNATVGLLVILVAQVVFGLEVAITLDRARDRRSGRRTRRDPRRLAVGLRDRVRLIDSR